MHRGRGRLKIEQVRSLYKTKPNTTLPLTPISKTGLEIISLLDKETYLKPTEIIFSLPTSVPVLQASQGIQRSYLGSALF